MIRKRAFAAVPDSIRAARHFAAQALLGSPAAVIEDIQLMVAVLATNVIQHAQTDFRVTIELTEDEIRVEVADAGDGRPTLRSPHHPEVSGRGLRIVDRLCTRWGVRDETGSGKVVWFTLAFADTGRRAAARVRSGPAPPPQLHAASAESSDSLAAEG